MKRTEEENRAIYNKVMECVGKKVREELDKIESLDECDGGGDCCGGDFGGVGGAYSTPMNTVGVGDPVPAGFDSYGSGDRFDYYPMQGRKGSKKPRIATKK